MNSKKKAPIKASTDRRRKHSQKLLHAGKELKNYLEGQKMKKPIRDFLVDLKDLINIPVIFYQKDKKTKEVVLDNKDWDNLIDYFQMNGVKVTKNQPKKKKGLKSEVFIYEFASSRSSKKKKVDGDYMDPILIQDGTFKNKKEYKRVMNEVWKAVSQNEKAMKALGL